MFEPGLVRGGGREKKKKKEEKKRKDFLFFEKKHISKINERKLKQSKKETMFSRLFLLLALFAASAAARRAPVPSVAPAAASFWNIETAPNAEVMAEAATGAPEPLAAIAPKKVSPSIAAAPAPSHKHHHRPRGSADAADDELDAELDEEVAAAANAFAQIAAGAQEIQALIGDEAETVALDDASAAAAALGQLPTFLEIHEDDAAAAAAPMALPAEAAPHGLVAVGDDAIFAAADSAAASVSSPMPSAFSDLQSALEAAAMTGNALIVVDDDTIGPDVVPVAGE